MKLLYLLVAFALLSCTFISLGAQTRIVHYEIAANLMVPEKHLEAELTIQLSGARPSSDTLFLILHRDAQLSEITLNDIPTTYFFDTSSAAPNRYLPDGRGLSISPKLWSESTVNTLNIRYLLPLNRISHGTSACTPEWTELAVYSAWYPSNSAYGEFTYSLSLTLPSGYLAFGNAEVKQVLQNFQFSQPLPGTDIAIVASNQLQTRTVTIGNATIRVNSVRLKAAETELYTRNSAAALELFSDLFGPLPEAVKRQELQLWINPLRDESSYARPGFISMQVKDANQYDIDRKLGHEIAHFWWRGAPTDSWEDWLNESFAEYSSMILAQQLYGLDSLQKLIKTFRDQATDLPPIFQTPRADDKSAFIVYRKGPILLTDLAQRIGNKAFLSILRAMAGQSLKTTDQLISFISKYSSPEDASWFNDRLRL
jgi:hypothetical protein